MKKRTLRLKIRQMIAFLLIAVMFGTLSVPNVRAAEIEEPAGGLSEETDILSPNEDETDPAGQPAAEENGEKDLSSGIDENAGDQGRGDPETAKPSEDLKEEDILSSEEDENVEETDTQDLPSDGEKDREEITSDSPEEIPEQLPTEPEIIQEDISFSALEAYGADKVIDTTVPVDFVFVIDSTGSMGAYISSVKKNLTAFCQYLQSKNVNLNIAIIDYRDITCDGADSTRIHSIGGKTFVSDADLAIEEFNSIEVDGGGDIPETAVDALSKLCSESLIPWRKGSNKFAFLLTDADSKEDTTSSSIKSMEDLIYQLRLRNIHTTVVSRTSYMEHYKNLYTMTGGEFIDISSSNYYELMLDVADWVYENALADTDGDGLYDEWETEGYDADGDGTADLDLKSMGADPNVPDLFVEIDWMVRNEVTDSFLGIKYTKTKGRNLKPSSNALRMVYDQFRRHGIRLHIDAGPDSTDFVTGRRWGSLSGGTAIAYQDNFNLGTGSNNYANWNKMAVDHFDSSRWPVFRYCMFINKFNGTGFSGIAENIPGQFFIVADQNGWISGNDISTAGTFMHELGHTLGLKHGSTDHIRYKPNHLSIMNYSFQTTGLLGTNEVNYSDYALPALNEASLNESRGVDPEGVTAGKNIGTKWWYEKSFLWTKSNNAGEKISLARQPIDFNNNGRSNETGIKVNLNKAKGHISASDPEYSDSEILSESVNEWANLAYSGGLIGEYGASLIEEEALIEYIPAVQNELREITYEEAVENGIMGNPGEVNVESVTPASLFQNKEGQKIYINLVSLSPVETTASLEVHSDLFVSDYNGKVNAGSSLGEVNTCSVDIPVRPDIEAGRHTVTYTLRTENNTVYTDTVTIMVYEEKTVTIDNQDSYNPGIGSDIVYHWSSSDEKVATVDSNGTVTPRGNGSAVITGVSDQGDNIVYTVTFTHFQDEEKLLDPVKDLKAEGISKNKALLSWKAVDGADGYLILGLNQERTGKQIAYTGKTTWTDTKADSEDFNYYWVMPYYKNSSGKIIAGPLSNYVYAVGRVVGSAGKPAVSVTTEFLKPSVSLQWPAVTGANEYLIIYKEGDSARKSLYTDTTEYTFTDPAKDEVTYYWICGIYKNTSGNRIAAGAASPYAWAKVPDTDKYDDILAAYSDILAKADDGSFSILNINDDDIPDMIRKYETDGQTSYRFYINGNAAWFNGLGKGGVVYGGKAIYSYYPRRSLLKMIYADYPDYVKYYHVKYHNGEYDLFEILNKVSYGIYESYLGPDDSSGTHYDYVFGRMVWQRPVSETRMNELLKSYSGGVKEQACSYIYNNAANRQNYLGK